MIDPRPVGGTHERTRCQGCGGWQDERDGYFHVVFGFHSPPERVWLCWQCSEDFWNEGIGRDD